MPEQSHRHAAIMFTDIVGYTALMGSDEDKAFEILEKNTEIHNKLIAEHKGALIKAMGDGMLVSFNLASDAVRCAIEIQKECKAQNIPLKIGIHEGEMVFADADVLGDAVNIASRLQDDAEVGSISISSSVYKNVRNKAGINTSFVEERTFKNVEEPVKVYHVLNEGEEAQTVPNRQEKPGKKYLYYLFGAAVIVLAIFLIRNYLLTTNPAVIDKERSIAVMPFDNESTDEENEYFVNGMMEDIRNNLSLIGDLRVISKTSTERYRETTLSSLEIGKELSINYLLEGTVQKRGNQVKIHAQLISTENDDHIWQDTYLRDISDIKEIFKIQSSIAEAIAYELEAVITPEEKELISSIPTENTEAYDLYLKGFFYEESYTVEGYKQGLIFFEKAIEMDSNFALAYYGVALTYIWRSTVWGDLSPEEASKNAMPNITKALELNPQLSEARTLLGIMKLYFQWDFKGAEEEYLEAIKLRPDNSLVLFSYVNFLNYMERHEEAFYWENKLNLIASFRYADPTLFWLGRIADAIQTGKERVNLMPSPNTYTNLGFVLLNSGGYQEAIDAQQKAIDLAGRRTPRMIAWLAAAYAKNGQVGKANELLNELKEIREKSLAGSPSFYIAVIYSALDDNESAFQWLEQAYEDHDMEMVWLKTEPQLYPLHDDPRFQDLVKRVGFPELD